MHWPTFRLRRALLLLLLFASVGLVQGLIRRGEAGSDPVLAWHLTGAVAAWTAFPTVQLATLNSGRRPIGALLAHAAGYVAFTIAHVAVMLLLRAAFDVQSIAPLGTQVAWEAQADLVLYAALASGYGHLHAQKERQARELTEARLAAQLADARLAGLTAKLDPHFLFNALNTVNARMHEDLPATERLLENIGEMLRASLESEGATWSLADEKAHTTRYLEILAERFGDARHSVRWELAPSTLGTPVPRFSVQSLVENAVKHNGSRGERLSIRIQSRIHADDVALVVEDDGLGFPLPFEPPPAHGLTRLREMLHLLFGPAARLELSRCEPTGARVTLALPGASS